MVSYRFVRDKWGGMRRIKAAGRLIPPHVAYDGRRCIALVLAE